MSEERCLTLVAFGGNALLTRDDHGTVEEQRSHAEAAAEWLVDLVAAGHDLVLVHGNGPQVGHVLIQMEEAATKVPPGSLDVAVAQTQGSMGYLLELALRNRLADEGLGVEVGIVLSLVVVDRDDPGFEDPTKPIGPYFSRYRAEALEREQGWTMEEVGRGDGGGGGGGGWRKVVASPKPLEVLGVPALRGLLDVGSIVIAGGGGGVPVVREPDGRLVGVEAVVDKDFTAALLGRELEADLLVILTNVDRVSKSYGEEDEEPLPRLTAAEARELFEAGHFPPGSMGPKIEAAIGFVETTGKRVLITDIDHLPDALDGAAGTEIVP